MRLLRADFEQPTTSSGFTLPNCMASLQTYSRPHGDVPEVRVLLAFELSDFADRSVDSTALQSSANPRAAADDDDRPRPRPTSVLRHGLVAMRTVGVWSSHWTLVAGCIPAGSSGQAEAPLPLCANGWVKFDAPRPHRCHRHRRCESTPRGALAGGGGKR